MRATCPEVSLCLKAVGATALLALAAACVTPSVPIPPPDIAKMSFEINAGDGIARFVYQPDPSYGGAIVYVFNRNLGEGIITTAEVDGSVGPTQPFPAALNDQIVVSFELDEQLSSRCVIAGEGLLQECDL